MRAHLIQLHPPQVIKSFMEPHFWQLGPEITTGPRKRFFTSSTVSFSAFTSHSLRERQIGTTKSQIDGRKSGGSPTAGLKNGMGA